MMRVNEIGMHLLSWQFPDEECKVLCYLLNLELLCSMVYMELENVTEESYVGLDLG